MFGRNKVPKRTGNDTSIGRILVAMGVIDEGQLAAAVQRKLEQDDAVLGAFLKEMGVVDDAVLQKALRFQKVLREEDEATAALHLMELRLDAFGEREDRITAAIEQRKQESRDRGETSGVWFFSMSPGVE